jgi:hypothetical protein
MLNIIISPSRPTLVRDLHKLWDRAHGKSGIEILSVCRSPADSYYRTKKDGKAGQGVVGRGLGRFRWRQALPGRLLASSDWPGTILQSLISPPKINSHLILRNRQATFAFSRVRNASLFDLLLRNAMEMSRGQDFCTPHPALPSAPGSLAPWVDTISIQLDLLVSIAISPGPTALSAHTLALCSLSTCRAKYLSLERLTETGCLHRFDVRPSVLARLSEEPIEGATSWSFPLA